MVNKNNVLLGVLSFFVLMPLMSSADLLETTLWLTPPTQTYSRGDTIHVDLYADILQEDEIFGFSFDLSFDGGTTFVSSIGVGGAYLTFDGFVANNSYFDTSLIPLFDDGDTIAGEVNVSDPLVWGDDILLGRLFFIAPITGDLGTESISIYPAPGDYGIFGGEGLLGSTALMPNSPNANIAPVPEPASIILCATGLIALIGLRRKVDVKNRKIR